MGERHPLAREVADRQIAMFASFVGVGRHISRVALAAASRVPESSLREYAGGATMPVHVLLALRLHLPGAALDMLTEPGGARLIDVEREAANWDAVAAATSGLTFEICEARADGQIDHVERAQLRSRARTLAAQLANLAEE